MKYQSALMTVGSGKVGGIVASHNRGGTYFRKFTIPVNTNTAQQQVLRNAMSSLQTRFAQTLTAAQRTGWNTYGANVPTTNTLGATIHLTGQQWYVKCNSLRVQVGLTIVDAPPVVWDMATLTIPVPTITAAGTTVSMAYTNTDAWAGEVGGSLLVYASRPKGPTISFFAGPYRFAGRVNGAGTPPTSPAVITLPFVSGPTGSKQFFRVLAVRADGRVSPAFRVDGTV